jgi:MFS family permease
MKYLINFSVFKRNHNFALLYTGQFVSFMGTMITGVALPYQIYTETHSTLMVGLLSLVQLLPLLVTALVGGVFADRYHRRMLLLISESILAVGSLLLAFNASLPQPHIWVLFVVSSFMSAFNGLHRPALESIVQQIVAKHDLPAVSSLASLKGSVAMIGGPAVGGILIAKFGLVTTYMVDVATFVISLTALALMSHIPKPENVRDDSTWTSLKQGFRYAFSRQELVGTYVIDFVAMIFGMPTALFPAIAMTFGGAKVLGMLYAAPAVGGLFIAFVSGWTKQVKRHGVAIAIAATLWGVSIILFGLSENFWVALFFLALAGAFDGISGIFRMTMWNETIPNHYRGRLAGIEMISYLSGPRLGDTEAGLVAAAFGITASIISGGALCIISVGVCCLFLPKFWRYRSDTGVHLLKGDVL